VLRPGGALLIAVKAGASEGWMEDEVTGYYERAGFRIELIERRTPYDKEIENDRIYAIGVRDRA